MYLNNHKEINFLYYTPKHYPFKFCFMWSIQMKCDQIEALILRILNLPVSFSSNKLAIKASLCINLQMNKDFGVISTLVPGCCCINY